MAKMWITNAGFADIFTVFAQVEGDKFTGFILEKGMAGFTLGAEEKKTGYKRFFHPTDLYGKRKSTRRKFVGRSRKGTSNCL